MATPCLQERLETVKSAPRLKIHSLHRYYGKLIPAIPASAIEQFTKPGDLVFDPFCGSGTTLVEAVVRGRDAVGVDINPLATLIARVKTTRAHPESLQQAARQALRAARLILNNGLPDAPYCVNIHHWYRPGVIRELTALSAAIRQIRRGANRDFLSVCLSAINRNVSNADPHHVFPGYSKRLRRLDSERGRRINVFDAFAGGFLKRLDYLQELLERWRQSSEAVVLRAHADAPPPIWRPVDLIVTNPPYISSVRYLETLKLEMSWAGYIHNPEEYRELDRMQIGTERFSAKELEEADPTGIGGVDRIVRELRAGGQKKMSHTVALYFRRMGEALTIWDGMLRPGGRVVLKIGPSQIRGHTVPTPDIIAAQLVAMGYRREDVFQDEYDSSSRSLLTARNYYSGRMDSDWIVVMRKP